MNILCFGDSNTYGYIAGVDDERYDRFTRWSGRLQQMLGEQFHVTEAGVNGRTTVFKDEICPGQSGLNKIRLAMKASEPDLLIIMLGTNDCKKQFAVSAEEIAENLEKVLELAEASAGKPYHTLVIAPAVLTDAAVNGPFRDSFDRDSVAKSEKLAETYEKLARRHKYAFLDASHFAKVSEIDGVHLDEEGHQRLAGAVHEKILEILKDAGDR